jgi:AraC family transcriptional regulator, regulatory protein of adaptative response / methylated-DNA-[protein]-cysteine methyltransferase
MERTSMRDSRLKVAIGKSTIGLVLVAQSDIGLRAVHIGDDAATLTRELESRFPAAELLDPDDETRVLLERVIAYVESPSGGFDLPLDIQGTEFQRTVWKALREIPSGTTVSYTDLAAQIGKPSAVRAVANACARNSHAVLIPCHRVVGRDGKLTGYRWGLERKTVLLQREQPKH